MPVSNLTLNPYRPTLVPDSALEWVEFNPSAEVMIRQIRKDTLYREITLSGFLDAKIELNARSGNEFVRVAGKKVASKICWWYVPRFDFVISTPEGNLRGAIEVRIAWLLFVRSFRLTLNDQLVYHEP